MTEIDNIPIQESPLQEFHQSRSARMVSFSGMSLPIQYPTGIKIEHLAARENAALFDVSHMVQIQITSPKGIDAVTAELRKVFPINFDKFTEGQTKYSFLLTQDGGILDDVMVSHIGDHLFIVANGARRDHDPDYLRSLIGDDLSVTVLSDQAFMALQGPSAAEVLIGLLPEASMLSFMQTTALNWRGVPVRIFRQGYSGEDGFEISVPASHAIAFAEALCADNRVIPAGLGARDSLRLEAGLPLWGQDIDANTTPLEANLGFAIHKARRLDGGFIGAETLIAQCATPPALSLIGLTLQGKQPARAGVNIHATDDPNSPIIGSITSGGVSPSLGMPIALAKIQRASSGVVYAEVRGKMLPADITPLPFMPHRYFRTPKFK